MWQHFPNQSWKHGSNPDKRQNQLTAFSLQNSNLNVNCKQCVPITLFSLFPSFAHHFQLISLYIYSRDLVTILVMFNAKLAASSDWQPFPLNIVLEAAVESVK